MNSSDFQEPEAIRYFFGEMSETELTAFEERFFLDAEFGDWLDEIETDLIDSYARGEFGADAKRKFERNYLISERRRERVKAAKILWENEKELSVVAAEVESSAPPAQNVSSFWDSLKAFFRLPQFGVVYAAGVVLILFLLAGILFWRPRNDEIVRTGNENINATRKTPENFPTPNSSIQTPLTENQNLVATNTKSANSAVPGEPRSQSTPTPKTETPRQPQMRQPPATAPVIAAFSLFPVVRSGGGEPQKLSLKDGAQSVRLNLARESEEEFAKYRTELRDARGTLIFTRDLKSRKSLSLSIPARTLRTGNYELTLKGAKSGEDFQDLNFYNFSINQK